MSLVFRMTRSPVSAKFLNHSLYNIFPDKKYIPWNLQTMLLCFVLLWFDYNFSWILVIHASIFFERDPLIQKLLHGCQVWMKSLTYIDYYYRVVIIGTYMYGTRYYWLLDCAVSAPMYEKISSPKQVTNVITKIPSVWALNQQCMFGSAIYHSFTLYLLPWVTTTRCTSYGIKALWGNGYTYEKQWIHEKVR